MLAVEALEALEAPARAAVTREWSRSVPAEWDRRLREISPMSRVVPWLALRWFPMRRPIDGVWTDCGRWLLSECVPEEVIADRDRDIVTILQGPKPSTLPEQLRDVVLSMVNDYQWTMYRAHRVWARELWILQGSTGGHATGYTQEERNVCQLAGLPTDPPAVGDLPYAPFDERVVARMRQRNRLIQLGGSLDALRKSGDPETIKQEEQQAAKEFRRSLLAYLETQSAVRAEMITTFTRKSENRGALREVTPQERNAAARLKDEYIETGTIPS